MMLERVSIRFQQQLWSGISIAISPASDVYVNYLGDDRKMHTSYHPSGQHHHKLGNSYVEWNAGPTAHWQPMKEPKTKPTEVFERESVAVWGWTIASIRVFCQQVRRMAEW
jgi:hypothetical protein